uniref:Uncharacterized protein n=1 Tax=Arundo donax TaxID=35708 RepID=A0A0A8Z8D9_ARUDO
MQLDYMFIFSFSLAVCPRAFLDLVIRPSFYSFNNTKISSSPACSREKKAHRSSSSIQVYQTCQPGHL